MTLDKTFYSLLLVTGRIRDIGQNVLLSYLATGRIRDIGQNVLQSYFQTGSSSSSHLLAHFLLYSIPPGGLYYKYNNCTVLNYVITVRINDKNAVINNLWKTPRTYSALQYSMGTRKDVFEIRRQVGHSPSERFANSGLWRRLHHSVQLSHFFEQPTFERLLIFLKVFISTR